LNLARKNVEERWPKTTQSTENNNTQRKLLKMTMEIHNQHENQQHLQVMQAMTLICIAKHQQEEKME
jgi:hypothetical protein